MLVRLMNVSLTPNKQLGRNLYSFSAQANEIGKWDGSTLTPEEEA